MNSLSKHVHFQSRHLHVIWQRVARVMSPQKHCKATTT